MTQWVKTLAAKLNDLSSTPRTQKLEELIFTGLSSALHTCTLAYICPFPEVHKQQPSKLFHHEISFNWYFQDTFL